jgi:hypothetical protein
MLQVIATNKGIYSVFGTIRLMAFCLPVARASAVRELRSAMAKAANGGARRARKAGSCL